MQCHTGQKASQFMPVLFARLLSALQLTLKVHKITADSNQPTANCQATTLLQANAILQCNSVCSSALHHHKARHSVYMCKHSSNRFVAGNSAMPSFVNVAKPQHCPQLS
jgi:hypothetical protein